MNIIKQYEYLNFDCKYHYNMQNDIVGQLLMALSKKSGWGLAQQDRKEISERFNNYKGSNYEIIGDHHPFYSSKDMLDCFRKLPVSEDNAS